MGYNTTSLDPEGGGNPEKNIGGGHQELIQQFYFQGTYTEEVKRRFMSIQERDVQKISRYLRTDPNSVTGIIYHVYDTREGKQQADPNHSISRASARYDDYAIYRYWKPEDDPSFPHELTHLVAHRWAEPYQFTTELDTADGTRITKTLPMVSTSFMQEGLAIAVDEILFIRMLNENGRENYVDMFCREVKEKLPTSLRDVINFAGFGSISNEIVVPFSASFSKYLLGEYGLEKYKKMYIGIKEIMPPEENVACIETIYGKNEHDLLGEWRTKVLSF